jgi:hypothetical protein
MNQPSLERWESQIQTIATTFPYPPTPDLSGIVQQRLQTERKPRGPVLFRYQLAWAILLILFVLIGLLAVPQVRAAVVEFLQLGAIRIFLVDPTPTATLPLATASPEATATATPLATPTPLASVLDLAGETSLAEAQAKVGFPIRLPTYPSDLGEPDRVFLQELGGAVVVLVWLETDQPQQVRLSLHQLGPGAFAEKGQPRTIQETTVNGQPALWTEGPYVLQFQRNDQAVYELRQLVSGHVLLWTEGEITYRLETGLPLAEARQIAESLP